MAHQASAEDRDENVEGALGNAAAGVESGVDTGKELPVSLYLELRQMAAAKMAKEKPQTLQATALGHEAWLKLGEQRLENPAHFFGAAAKAMRRVQVEVARSLS